MKNNTSHSSQTIRNAAGYAKSAAILILISAVIGCLCGAVGSVFCLAVSKATSLRSADPWLIYFLPLGGLLITFLYRFTNTEGRGTNDIISSVLSGEKVPLLLAPVILVSTALTHLLGGSAGREGAALQIGGSLGWSLGRLFKMDEKHERLAVLGGMAAVFSALFGTPITATIFVLEVCSVGIMHYSGLVPCGIAAFTAYGVSLLFGITPEKYIVTLPGINAVILLKVALLALFCGLVSILFCKVMHNSHHMAERLIPNPWLRVLAGSAIIIFMTWLAGSQDYNGGGTHIIEKAISGESVDSFAFIFKIVFTAVTLACGFKGGEIVPTFFIGATFGAVAGPLIGIPQSLAAAVGMVSVFCGCVNCPLASVLLSVELFGGDGIMYYAAACFVAYLSSGYAGLYSRQKIMYSKINAEFINITTR